MKGRNQTAPAYMHGYRTGNVSVATATAVTVGFNTVVQDPLGMLDTGTGIVEIIVPGYYAFHASIWWNGETSPVSSSYRYMQWETSDDGVGWGIMSAPSTIRANNAATSDTVHTSTQFFGPFVTGDFVRLRIAQASGETITLLGGGHTRISAVQLPGKVR